MVRKRGNPEIEHPNDFSDGVKKYMEFNQLEPTKVGVFGFCCMPKTVAQVGLAGYTCYRSKKWAGSKDNPKGKHFNYIHHHAEDVKVYSPEVKGKTIKVPDFIKECTTLVLLGEFMGLGYAHDAEQWSAAQDDDEIFDEAQPTSGHSELYCVPSGNALVVVEDKKHVSALIWGGYLDVTARGIVY